MTYVKTLKSNTRYPVTAIENGILVTRQPSGRRKLLSVRDVGRARYESAVAHFYAEAAKS